MSGDAVRTGASARCWAFGSWTFSVPQWRLTMTSCAPAARAVCAVREDPLRVDLVGGPGRSGRQVVAVEPIGVGEVGDLHALHVVDPRRGGLLRGSGTAGVTEVVGVERVEGRLDPVQALIEGVVRHRRAAVVAGGRRAGHQLGGRAEDGVAMHPGRRRRDRDLHVADRQVGAADDRAHRRQHRRVVVGSAGRLPERCRGPVQGHVRQQVAGERQRDRGCGRGWRRWRGRGRGGGGPDRGRARPSPGRSSTAGRSCPPPQRCSTCCRRRSRARR